MIYVISEAEKYFGFYDNITLMDQNIIFLKNNNIVKNVVIYKLNNLSFGTELVEKPSPVKTISKKIFVIYDKINNKFITYHESENYLKEMIKFFKTNYEVLEIILNSININFKIEVKEEEKKENDVQVEQEDQPEVSVQEEKKDEELEEYSQSVKRRIDKLTRKMREAERREQAAIEYAKKVQEQQKILAAQVKQRDTQWIGETEKKLDAQEEFAKRALQAAIQENDTEKQVEAQQAISKMAVERQNLATQKLQVEAEPEEQPAPILEQPANNGGRS